MTDVPSLALHVNDKAKLERAARFEAMRRYLDEIEAAEGSMAAYAFVAFSETGAAAVAFDTAGIMPLWAFDAAAQRALAQLVDKTDETFTVTPGAPRWDAARGTKP